MTERVDRLIEAGRRAAERAERERRQASASGSAPRPGDLYALPATAEHDVEWLVVAAAGEGRWLLLPADLDGTGGATDVEVPADEPGGPLTVYGRFPVTVPPGLLLEDLRTGRLSEERRAEAERRWRDLAAGAEPPEHEADFDPDYRRRLVELAAAQRELSAAAAASAGGGGAGGDASDGDAAGPVGAADARPSPLPVLPPARLRPRRKTGLRPPRWMSALAAVLVISVLALLGWNLQLLRQIERLSSPRQVTLAPQVVVDDPPRGAYRPSGLEEEEEVYLPLVWTLPPRPGESFRFVVAAGDEELAVVEDVRPDEGGVALVAVPRTALRPGARLLLYRDDHPAGAEPLFDRPVERVGP